MAFRWPYLVINFMHLLIFFINIYLYIYLNTSYYQFLPFL